MASDHLLQAYGVDEASDLLDSWRTRERRIATEQALRLAAKDSPFGGRWLTRRADRYATGARL